MLALRNPRHAAYEAPFPVRGKEPPEDIIPGAYGIVLAKGRTVDDVSRAIGRDIGPYVDTVVDNPSFVEEYGLHFSVTGVDDELLAAIRSYEGVVLVEYSTPVRPADG
jgi:hypothetical protein